MNTPNNTPKTNGQAQPAADQNQSPAEPSFHIRRIYLKDFSLEQPNTPALLLNQNEEPVLSMEVQVQAKPVVQKTLFEAVVSATVQTKIQEKTLFLIEAQQAGLFELNHIPEQQVGPILGITCPHILYPYLRANIADAINKAGFATIHLEEINFQALYEQETAKNQAASQSEHSTSTDTASDPGLPG